MMAELEVLIRIIRIRLLSISSEMYSHMQSQSTQREEEQSCTGKFLPSVFHVFISADRKEMKRKERAVGNKKEEITKETMRRKHGRNK